MSGPPRVRSMNVAADPAEPRPVLGPAGNKAAAPARKPAMKKAPAPVDSPPVSPRRPPAVMRRQEILLQSNLSLNASCSSDASTDSFCSRASTGRIGRASPAGRRRTAGPRTGAVAAKLETVPLPEMPLGKRRCSWVTSNTDPCYVAFHDEEWGVPVHDDRKLFEQLVLSGALAELTWPAILCKRHTFREVFMDFDPLLVSKLNEKKLIAPGSTASSLLSEPKLRAILENARQILKIIEEFGSFDKYCWSFVNYKPIVSRFRYPRQVPVKTPKADVISKDLVRRGFRSVGPTVIYSFMQVVGISNDHLTSCYRFEECVTAATAPSAALAAAADEKDAVKVNHKADEMIITIDEVKSIDLELSKAVDGLVDGLSVIS